MDSDFYKVDLHIHTPASSCYKREKQMKNICEFLKKQKHKN